VRYIDIDIVINIDFLSEKNKKLGRMRKIFILIYLILTILVISLKNQFEEENFMFNKK
jgi:hypothetical protein